MLHVHVLQRVRMHAQWMHIPSVAIPRVPMPLLHSESRVSVSLTRMRWAACRAASSPSPTSHNQAPEVLHSECAVRVAHAAYRACSVHAASLIGHAYAQVQVQVCWDHLVQDERRAPALPDGVQQRLDTLLAEIVLCMGAHAVCRSIA